MADECRNNGIGCRIGDLAHCILVLSHDLHAAEDGEVWTV
jgi:hypothetical protein